MTMQNNKIDDKTLHRELWLPASQRCLSIGGFFEVDLKARNTERPGLDIDKKSGSLMIEIAGSHVLSTLIVTLIYVQLLRK